MHEDVEGTASRTESTSLGYGVFSRTVWTWGLESSLSISMSLIMGECAENADNR
jgi:hypothetical protein